MDTDSKEPILVVTDCFQIWPVQHWKRKKLSGALQKVLDYENYGTYKDLHSCKPNIYVSWSISELRVR